MRYDLHGVEYDLDPASGETRKEEGLRVAYRVPWCPLCNNYVERFSIEHNTPGPGRDTLVACCHGKTHTKEIRTETGNPIDLGTDVFFDDPKMRTLEGRDVKEKVGRIDHDMHELDGRLKSTGLGEIGTGGEIVWTKK